jgi:hypothetical protein
MRQFCAAAILVALSFPCAAQEVTPQAIRAMLREADASAVVQSLDAGDKPANAWTQLIGRIEGGEAAWLDLVPLLKPGTDAATAEDLKIALSRALRANPQGVLALVAGACALRVDVVAEGLAGSEEEFANRMNKKAKEIGLTGSNFTNSSGWPAPTPGWAWSCCPSTWSPSGRCGCSRPAPPSPRSMRRAPPRPAAW